MTEEQNNNQEVIDNEVENNDQVEDQNQDIKDENEIEEVEPTTFDYDLIEDDPEEDDTEQEGEEEKKDTKKKSNKALDAVNEIKLNNAINSNMNDYFDKHPEAKEYRKVAEKFVQHPSRIKFIKSGLPVSAVIAEALAPYQQRIGANKLRQADQEANQVKDGGGKITPKSPGKVDYSKMSNADIRKMAQQVKNGRYNG